MTDADDSMRGTTTADDIVLPARVDGRPLARRLVAPVLTAAGTIAATTYIAVADPNEPGRFPTCPTQALFGVDCPLCGGLRAVHALAHGDIAAAVDFNVLVVIAAPFAVIAWAMWLVRSVRGVHPAVTRRQHVRRTRITVAVLVLVALFGVVRNVVPFLGSAT